ncbi:MAG: hypothetical protein II939_14425 [Bacteroidales bacterium]|nr:hypothetical protein [Bacteroidales bacterium]
MKKINYLMAMFIAAVLCVGLVSCKKSKNDDDPQPEQSKFLTVDEFAKSTWTGTDDKGNAITLKVESASVAKVTYFKTTQAKNTDPTPVTITISGYTYNFSTGKFQGTGVEDSFPYEATLSDKNNMQLKMPLGTFPMKR